MIIHKYYSNLINAECVYCQEAVILQIIREILLGSANKAP